VQGRNEAGVDGTYSCLLMLNKTMVINLVKEGKIKHYKEEKKQKGTELQLMAGVLFFFSLGRKSVLQGQTCPNWVKSPLF
jgi:hypothetical protein